MIYRTKFAIKRTIVPLMIKMSKISEEERKKKEEVEEKDDRIGRGVYESGQEKKEKLT